MTTFDDTLLDRVCAKLRLQYGWTAKQCDKKRLRQVFAAIASIHIEEEKNVLKNKKRR